MLALLIIFRFALQCFYQLYYSSFFLMQIMIFNWNERYSLCGPHFNLHTFSRMLLPNKNVASMWMSAHCVGLFYLQFVCTTERSRSVWKCSSETCILFERQTKAGLPEIINPLFSNACLIVTNDKRIVWVVFISVDALIWKIYPWRAQQAYDQHKFRL